MKGFKHWSEWKNIFSGDVCYQIEGFEINDLEYSSIQGDNKSWLWPQVFTEEK